MEECYSLSRLDTNFSTSRISRNDPGGIFSKTGQIITEEDITLNCSTQDLILFKGGSGITPKNGSELRNYVGVLTVLLHQFFSIQLNRQLHIHNAFPE